MNVVKKHIIRSLCQNSYFLLVGLGIIFQTPSLCQVDSLNKSAQQLLLHNLSDSAIQVTESNLVYYQNTNDQISVAQCLKLLGQAYFQKADLPKALRYYLQALKTWESFDTIQSNFELQYQIAQLYEQWGVSEKAFEYYQKAYHSGQNANNNYGSIQALEGMAESKYALQDYRAALSYFQELNSWFQKEGVSANQITALRNCIRVNRDMEQFDEALKTSTQLLELIETQKDTNGIIITLNNMGFLHRQLNNTKEALSNFNQALALEQSFTSDGTPNPTTLSNIGIIHQNLGAYPTSLEYLFKAVEQIKAAPTLNIESLANLYNLIGIVYLTTNDINNAYSYVQTALDLAELAQLKHIERDVQFTQSQIFEQVNDYRQALESYQVFAYLQDSLTRAEQIEREAFLRRRFSAEQTEKELSLLIVDKEIEELEFRRQQLETEKLKQDKFLQENIIERQELENERLERQQQIAQQKLEAEQKDLEIARLKNEQYEQALKLAQQKLETERSIARVQQLQNEQNLALREKETQDKAQQLLIEKQRNDLTLNNLQLNQEKNIRNFAIGILSLLLIILGLFIRNNQARREANQTLSAQKLELEHLVNKLKEAQTQLIQAEKMASLGQLTAGIAHEINNPINFVTTNAHALRLDLEDISQLLSKVHQLKKDASPTQINDILKSVSELETEHLTQEINELIASIERGANRTKNIIAGLRTFSHSTPEKFIKANLHEGLDATLTILNSKLKHHIHVHRNYGQIPLVQCQFDKINQVFMNVLNNAIQAIGDKDGDIFIKTSHQNNDIHISIKDSGVGMDESTRRRIFEPFFTTKEIGKGTGLGLSITYGIIEQHKGRVKVFSEAGKGTEFVITLPTVQKLDDPKQGNTENS